MAKKKTTTLKPSEIAHQKFLKKMGVTKKQLKERKQKREDGNNISNFRPDTIESIRESYD